MKITVWQTGSEWVVLLHEIEPKQVLATLTEALKPLGKDRVEFEEKDGELISQPMAPTNAMFHVVFIKKDFGGSLDEVDGFGLLAKAAVAETKRI